MDVSYSKVSLYDDCPSLFYDVYIKKIKLPTYVNVFGRVVHLAIKLYATGTDIEAAIAQAAEKEAAPQGIRVNREKIRKMAASYEVRDVKDLKNADKAFEEDFKVLLGDSPADPLLKGCKDFKLVFRNTDRSTKLVVLGDWKTGPTYDPRQLALYAWAESRQYGTGLPYIGWFVFLNEDNPDNRSRHFDISRQMMQEAREWAYSVAREIEGKLFQVAALEGDPGELFPGRTGSKQCRWCHKSLNCSKRREETGLQLIIPELITSLEEAEEVAGNILRLSEGCSILKELLKNWIRQNGELSIPEIGKLFCLAPAVAWAFTPEQKKAVFEQLKAEGRNPFEIFTLGSAQIKELGWPEDRLLGLGAKKAVKHNFSVMDAVN